MTKEGSKPDGNGADERGLSRQKYDFPRNPLEDTLRVAQAIEEANGGIPLTPLDTAAAMKLKPASDEFRMLVSSSFRYGLTKGVHTSLRISIEPLGQNIVRPQSEEEYTQALTTAALTPEVFAKMFELLKGKKIPDDRRYIQNTVSRELSIPKEVTDLCVNNFVANMEFVGLVRRISTGAYLSPDTMSVYLPASTVDADTLPPNGKDKTDSMSGIPDAIVSRQSELRTPSKPVKNAIFIGHGKNKVPLEQMKAMLNRYDIPHKIAIDEPNAFRPISQKVAEIMQSCGAGILIFTADEEFKDKDGNTIWRPSENVVFELGAASVLYGQKIIIFKEKSVTFPTNFKDIGYIEFDKDDLIAKANDFFLGTEEFWTNNSTCSRVTLSTTRQNNPLRNQGIIFILRSPHSSLGI